MSTPTVILRRWSAGHYRTPDERWLVDEAPNGGYTVTDTVGARSFHAVGLEDVRAGILDRSQYRATA